MDVIFSSASYSGVAVVLFLIGTAFIAGFTDKEEEGLALLLAFILAVFSAAWPISILVALGMAAFFGWLRFCRFAARKAAEIWKKPNDR